ncbi:hypothetical protein KBD08_04590 [Candidatus Babeliales bacterium]|nr:hypothetical protein [Candidatus Babeliales bacterium]
MNIKQQFGLQLKQYLFQNKTIDQMAPWLYDWYINFIRDQDPSFKDLLYELMMMDSGPEFELSYEKLHEIADTLIAGEDVKL